MRTKISFWSGEYRTWLVALLVYFWWGTLTWYHESVPYWLLFIMGGIVVCWHGSLQHETIHGHPTGKKWINSALGYLPLGLCYPYPIYRDSHLEHHDVDHLTHPEDDPESYYIFRKKWDELPTAARALLRVNHTAAGRLILGPILIGGVFLIDQALKLLKGERRYLWTWQIHLLLVGAVLHWIVAICGMPLGTYLLCFAYPGMSLTLLRSYLEHRPAPTQEHRSAVVEGGFFSLLYLGVNYHALHHREPWVPWYQLGPRYREEKEQILEENGFYHFDNYGDVVRRYAFSPKDSPVFPDPLR